MLSRQITNETWLKNPIQVILTLEIYLFSSFSLFGACSCYCKVLYKRSIEAIYRLYVRLKCVELFCESLSVIYFIYWNFSFWKKGETFKSSKPFRICAKTVAAIFPFVTILKIDVFLPLVAFVQSLGLWWIPPSGEYMGVEYLIKAIFFICLKSFWTNAQAIWCKTESQQTTTRAFKLWRF